MYRKHTCVILILLSHHDGLLSLTAKRKDKWVGELEFQRGVYAVTLFIREVPLTINPLRITSVDHFRKRTCPCMLWGPSHVY